jgi:hypothetical protein
LRRLRFVTVLTILGLAGSASAQQVALRWIPSASSNVSGYRVYVAPATTGPISAAPINVGNPAPSGGVSTALINVDRTRAWVAEMTAYNSSSESPRSNRVTIPALGEALGAPVYQADFQSSAAGTLPSGYLDPTGAFRVAVFADGNRALGAIVPRTGRIGARQVDSAVTSLASYELSGRINLLSGDSTGGVAVRVPYSNLSEYFMLGVDYRGVFALWQGGKAPLRCAASSSTGVSREAGRWYRFKLRFTNPGGRARLRAKVWANGAYEPASWQADCWTDVVLPLGSGAFALTRDQRSFAYWDDVVVRPVTGTLQPIP